MATSFYNEKNDDIAQDLVNVLVECECEVLDFLAHLKPQDGENLQFDDDTSEEVEAEEGADAVAEGGEGGESVTDG
ncbi:hypothetical protein LTR08_008148 [Meristemomyces frigidus]|nr:hypothetical protein LTR08_008148 [Meristemomyces frigidus]